MAKHSLAQRCSLIGLLLIVLSACGGGAATTAPQSTATAAADAPSPTPLISFEIEPTATQAPSDLPANFSGQHALELATQQMQWVPRDTGSEGWQATGDWIIATLTGYGWDVEEQYFPVPEGKQGRNIIAKRGTGPLKIIGAHYDARRYADQDPDPAKRQQPVPAANDGASGVAVLLELARVLQPDTLNEEVWLVFFDAEDNGDIGDWGWTLGSADLAPKLPRAPEAVVVVDMVGDADQQLYYEMNSTPALREQIWKVAADLGYTSFIAEPKTSVLDDHTAFIAQGYPAVDIIDFDYPVWHTTADTIDKLSAQSLETVGRTLETWLTQQ